MAGCNLGDRRLRGESQARTDDFEIENATIEVAVGLPDEKHLSQVVEALEDADLEVWLLTRQVAWRRGGMSLRNSRALVRAEWS